MGTFHLAVFDLPYRVVGRFAVRCLRTVAFAAVAIGVML